MKAIVLFSGGLDSSLAIKIMQEQGIDIIALNFLTPFCLCNRKKGCGHYAKKVAQEFGIEFKLIYLGEEYLEIIKNPKYGYGKNLNPCIDCRIMILRKAKEFMKEIGADFIVTGEVLGQRPKSQHRKALMIIEKEAGLEGLILRPLSAKLLPATIPEKMGWVRREKLLALQGRTRKPQIRLANYFGLKDYLCAAGGCLLTDPSFSKRMRDLIEHDELNLHNVELLKIGRHFRISTSYKLIVGRNEEENRMLLRYAQNGDLIFRPLRKGPLALGKGKYDEKLKELSARIVARYSSKENGIVEVAIKIHPQEEECIATYGLEQDQLENLRIGG